MRGVGARQRTKKTRSSANVTNFFCTPITIGGGGDARGGGIGVEDARGGGIGTTDGGGGIRLAEDGGGRIGLAEDVRGGGIGAKYGGGSGIGAKDGGGNVDGGGGGKGGGEDGGGKRHEDGMVQMTLPLGTYEDTKGISWVCFIPLGFSIETSNLAPYTMQKRLNCF
jgi:hypothetical protein